MIVYTKDSDYESLVFSVDENEILYDMNLS